MLGNYINLPVDSLYAINLQHAERLARALEALPPGARVLPAVHDEITIECPTPDLAEDTLKRIRAIMARTGATCAGGDDV